ncbi:MAG: YdcF family protein [Ferruginibacter sp.]
MNGKKIFLLISLPFLLGYCIYSASKSKKLLAKASVKSYDVIVVPGIPLRDGHWDSIMKARVYWSKYLFDKGIAKNIMYSGSSVYTPYYEAEVMALYAAALGIPREHIFTETKAEHSTENIYYGYHKSKKLGFNTIALATDPYQAKQLNSYAKLRISRSIGIIPIVFDTLKAMQPTMIDPVIDFSRAYNKDFKSITERESGWKRFKGTMSWNVDHKAYR